VRAGTDIVYYLTPSKQKVLDERVVPAVVGLLPQEESSSSREPTLYTLSFKINF
jgi:hypothetical protein